MTPGSGTLRLSYRGTLPRVTPKGPGRRGPDARRDERLGLNRSITRRDFLYGLPALAGLMAACRVERDPSPGVGPLPMARGAIDARGMPGGRVGDDWYGPGGVGDY